MIPPDAPIDDADYFVIRGDMFRFRVPREKEAFDGIGKCLKVERVEGEDFDDGRYRSEEWVRIMDLPHRGYSESQAVKWWRQRQLVEGAKTLVEAMNSAEGKGNLFEEGR